MMFKRQWGDQHTLIISMTDGLLSRHIMTNLAHALVRQILMILMVGLEQQKNGFSFI